MSITRDKKRTTRDRATDPRNRIVRKPVAPENFRYQDMPITEDEYVDTNEPDDED